MDRFLTGVLIGGVVGSWLIVAAASVFTTPTGHWQSEAIERGYALYCPNNGNFAWIGECE